MAGIGMDWSTITIKGVATALSYKMTTFLERPVQSVFLKPSLLCLHLVKSVHLHQVDRVYNCIILEVSQDWIHIFGSSPWTPYNIMADTNSHSPRCTIRHAGLLSPDLVIMLYYSIIPSYHAISQYHTSQHRLQGQFCISFTLKKNTSKPDQTSYNSFSYTMVMFLVLALCNISSCERQNGFYSSLVKVKTLWTTHSLPQRDMYS